MALYHKWDVKNDFAYVLQFFSLISDSLGSVYCQIDGEDFVNFCGLLRKRELYFHMADLPAHSSRSGGLLFSPSGKNYPIHV